jgi:hypothetical protein
VLSGTGGHLLSSLNVRPNPANTNGQADVLMSRRLRGLTRVNSTNWYKLYFDRRPAFSLSNQEQLVRRLVQLSSPSHSCSCPPQHLVAPLLTLPSPGMVHVLDFCGAPDPEGATSPEEQAAHPRQSSSPTVPAKLPIETFIIATPISSSESLQGR